MKKRIFTALLVLFVLIPMLTAAVSADTGPKPSTTITVHGGGGERMVLTLLGEGDQWGPHTLVEPDAEPEAWMVSNNLQEEAWYAFRDYEDPDGFYFWGEVFENGISWNYWPPEVFKVAVYYPDYDVLWVSEEPFERYAFRSEYRLILPAVGENAHSGILDMDLKKETDAAEEGFGLLVRILLTLAVEVTLAGFFGFRSKKQLKLILMTNLVTQVGLNVLLWAWYFYDGALAALIRLFLAEIVVLVAELTVYLRKLREGETAGRTVLYTLCANVLSVALGFLLLS